MELERNTVASLAARNPLLLGFLVCLSANGVRLGQRRVELYEQIIEQIRQAPLQDRTAPSDLARAVAWRIVEIAGWHLQLSPSMSIASLIESIGSDLESTIGLAPLAARQKAEEGLKFWEERRLIERLSVGHQELVTFIHLALGEYAAARYAAELCHNRLDEWLCKVRREPRWRDTILLAAAGAAGNSIVRCLVELDEPEDPISTEGILAATALEETTETSRELCRLIVARLQQRFVSPVPLLCLEAAAAALGLAPVYSEIVGAAIQNLFQHSQPWTRFAAMTLALASGWEFVSASSLEGWFDELSRPIQTPWKGFTRGDWFTGQGRDLQTHALARAADLLLEKLPGPQTTERIQRALLEPRNTYGTLRAVMTVVERRGCEEIIKHVNAKFAERMPKFETADWSVDTDADRALLEMILAATEEVSEPCSEEADLVVLAALVHGADWLEVEVPAWVVLRERHDVEAAVTVIRSTIAAMDLDPVRLRAQARWALSRLDEQEGPVLGLLGMIPKVFVEPNWVRGKEAQPDPATLARALGHPSDLIANTAAALLVNGAGGPTAAELIRQRLNEAGDRELKLIAWMAPRVWGDRALDIVTDRLGSVLTQGCEYLFRCLPDPPYAPSDHERITQAIAAGLQSGEPRVARGAAEAAARIIIQAAAPGLVGQLRRALDSWTKREAIDSGSGQGVRVTPPSPRPSLVRALASIGDLNVDRLVHLCSDSHAGVKESAEKSLMDAASRDRKTFVALLGRIRVGTAPAGLLTRIASLGAQLLRPLEAELVLLLSSPISEVRARTLDALPGGWIGKEKAAELAYEALRDGDPAVRNHAVGTLRVVHPA